MLATESREQISKVITIYISKFKSPVLKLDVIARKISANLAAVVIKHAQQAVAFGAKYLRVEFAKLLLRDGSFIPRYAEIPRRTVAYVASK